MVTQALCEYIFPAIDLDRPDERTRYDDTAFLELQSYLGLTDTAANQGSRIFNEETTRESGGPDGDTHLHYIKQLEDDDWTEVTWNEGTNGDLTGSFYRRRVRVCTDAYFGRVGEETGWLLLQRDHHSGTNDGEGELVAWLCWGLDEVVE